MDKPINQQYDIAEVMEVCRRWENTFDSDAILAEFEEHYHKYTGNMHESLRFYEACIAGHLYIAQWTHRPEDDVKDAFKVTCTCGHIKLAKWLHEIILSKDQSYTFEEFHANLSRKRDIRNIREWLRRNV